jgi:four helix bundle protein
MLQDYRKRLNAKSDLKKRCYIYSIKVIKFVETLPEKRVYWTISDQLVRSATSIGANIIEGKSASSRKDFIRFYDIALKSANETSCWLGLLKDALDADGIEMQFLIRETDELSRMIAASLITLKGKKYTGATADIKL